MMTISVQPKQAKKIVRDLESLLESYRLSQTEDLIEQIKPYWKGEKANDFKKKYVAIKEKLSANIACAKRYCEQTDAELTDIIRLDNQL